MRIGSRERVDAGGAVAAQHVGERDRRVGLAGSASCRGRRRDGRRASRAPCRLRDLVDDRLGDDVARPERVGELLAVGVQQDGAVGARRLGDRVALHVRRPGAAVRVVLERVEVARLGAELERDAGHLAGRVRVVGRELAARLEPRRSSARRRRERRCRPRSCARRRPRASRASVGSRLVQRGVLERRPRSALARPRAGPS